MTMSKQMLLVVGLVFTAFLAPVSLKAAENVKVREFISGDVLLQVIYYKDSLYEVRFGNRKLRYSDEMLTFDLRDYWPRQTAVVDIRALMNEKTSLEKRLACGTATRHPSGGEFVSKHLHYYLSKSDYPNCGVRRIYDANGHILYEAHFHQNIGFVKETLQ